MRKSYLQALLAMAFVQCQNPSSKLHDQSSTATDGVMIAKSEILNPEQEYEEIELEIDTNSQNDYVFDDWGTDRTEIDEEKYSIQLQSNENYTEVLRQIDLDRLAFKTSYEQAENDSVKALILDSAGKYLEEALLNRMFPHWYNTPWDYGGATKTPGSGSIACGYFTSTILKQCGFNINRLRFGQQTSMTGARSLQPNKPYYNYSRKSIVKIRKILLENHPDGLYKVGLDIHTGFILIRNGEVFFIHSNYVNAEGVVIEFATESYALINNSAFIFIEITGNPHLIRRWVIGEHIEIIKNS